ncbi:4'-phosphopantetheinyl transferase family protein [Laceyella tengchongensis]|jgi:4'-phosphopantetheinyl transferase
MNSFELDSRFIHLWKVPITEAPLFLEKVMSEREVNRYRSFRKQEDRARALFSYGLLRLLLAELLDTNPSDVPVTRACPSCGEEHGKPRVVRPDELPIELSVSHSGKWVVLGISLLYPFGVDIERIDRDSDLDGMARMSLSEAEQAAWAALPPDQRIRGFYRYWTRKEAIVKATGDGLTVSLKQVQVNPADQAPKLLAWQDRPEMVGEITCYPLALDEHTEGCVAVIGQVDGVRLYDGREVLVRWQDKLTEKGLRGV